MLNHYHHTFTHKPFSSFQLSHFKSVYSFKCIIETIQAKVENAAPPLFFTVNLANSLLQNGLNLILTIYSDLCFNLAAK